jgi:hypothetical protein
MSTSIAYNWETVLSNVHKPWLYHLIFLTHIPLDSVSKWGWKKVDNDSIGGAHQQTSERAAPPVSVEEKEKTTGDKRKMLLFLLVSIQY